MSIYETKDSPLYHAMAPFFPQVYPSKEFSVNLTIAMATDRSNRGESLEFSNEWLVKNAGLILDPGFGNEVVFRVVDEKLYVFALLRWS